VRLVVTAALAPVLLAAPAAAATLPVTSAVASSDDGNVAANAVDGSLATRWSGEGDGVWLRLDLGAATTVGAVSVAWYQGDTRRFTFDVQLSTDGSAWSTVLARTVSSGTTAGLEPYDVPDGPARYVRVVGHGNTKNAWTSVSEATVAGPGTTTPPPAHTVGVGGVATPPGATIVPARTAKYTITGSGSATAPRVYDCQGATIRGGLVIDADHVVVQNCRIDAQQQYGIYSADNTDVTIQNNDIKGIKGPGDLNAITFFGNGTKILYNTAVDFVTGDPGDSHTDFIQTWVSGSHPTASDDVQVRFNRAVGPANPGRDNGVASIHQFLMAEDYGRGGNSGGNTDGMRNWIVADNEIGDSWNQAVKLDGPDSVSVTRNRFVGSSTTVMAVTSASTGVRFYADNQVGSGYGSVGMTVTAGSGPA
jgi:hypothetical protein